MPSGKSKLARKGQSAASSDDAALLAKLPKGLGVAGIVKSKLHDAALAEAGLSEVDNWEGDVPDLPNDIGQVDHAQLSNLLAQFTNAFSTATWQASRFYIQAEAYKEIAEYLENVALLDADESSESKRRASAKTDEAVVTAKALQMEAHHNYVRFRDLAVTLKEKAKTVSRIGGFVGDEAGAEELNARKFSTRGKARGRR